MNFVAYTFSDLGNELDIFTKSYTIEEFIVCPIEEIKNLKPKEERRCRFCGLDYSQTTFDNKPHIISELLGNKYLISDFECDKCNTFFGANYENDLANFLGMSRTFSGVKNKKDKIPIFNSPGYNLSARRTEFHGIKEGLIISLSKSAKGIFNIDSKEGRTEIKYPKQPYIPLKVYKALLKIALSILPEKYVLEYQYTFEYLKRSDNKYSEVAKIIHYELPYNHIVHNPVSFLFKKLKPESRIINHVFALYFQNHVFQFPIPFSKVDIDNNLYNGEPYSVPLCPPLLLSKPEFGAKYFRAIKDLSSNEKVREEEKITFSFDPNIMNDLKAYDSKTGEVTDKAFDPDEITEIYIAPYNSETLFYKS
ncbi:HNH endonuclease [Adhaeribacter rhizoryzae]|uniref:HNH endonuclease n=1 Tax=Adhaeribacter rhizoryzae TaxID=2607907 RepID=A0A5M6D669_9BACT|nr:HNH endonuclease [Adhaeribacter rhizoryzae]KAA5542843.1 HNH endonuclease [Adhaeribacter rhizoryzae]